MPQTRRHILIMSSWFPTRIDPYVGNFVERFAHLIGESYQVTCLHTIGDRNIDSIEIDEEIQENVRIVRVYHPISKNKFIHWLKQRLALRKGLVMIEHVDLIFAHVFLPRAYQFEKAQRFFHCPLILLEHGSYFRKNATKKITSYQKGLIKRVSRHIQQILAVSNVLRDDMRPLFPTTPIDVLPNFVDDTIFTCRASLPAKLTKFLHISTLDPKTKNPNLLFEGFLNAYLASGKTISLTVVSDQDTYKWEKWCEQNSCAEAVTFIGPSTWSEIKEIIHAHHAVIVTSEYETFNIVLAEAWMTGTPVISTPVGIASNMPDFLGTRIEKNHIVDMKKALLNFASGNLAFDPQQIHTYSKQFASSNVKEQLKQLFEKHFITYD